MNELEQQHETAKVLHAYLTGRGYNATIELGGGGIIEITAPIVYGGLASCQLRYAPYATDEIIIECLENGEWVERPEFSRHELPAAGGVLIAALQRWIFRNNIAPEIAVRTAAAL